MVVIRIWQTLQCKRVTSSNNLLVTKNRAVIKTVYKVGVLQTCGFASILLTPSTKCERNFARSALLKRDLLTEAIWTRHDNTCTHKHNIQPQTRGFIHYFWCVTVIWITPHLPMGKGTEGWNDINWKRAAEWRNQEMLQDRNKTDVTSFTITMSQMLTLGLKLETIFIDDESPIHLSMSENGENIFSDLPKWYL